MQKVNLLTLAEGVLNWAEMETRIVALSSEQERGEVFEQFCKAYFHLNPLFQTDKEGRKQGESRGTFPAFGESRGRKQRDISRI